MAVTPAMIAVALGVAAPDPGSVQELQWQMWIDDAAMLIEARRLEIDDTLVIDTAKLDYVIREAVVAQAKRPDSATQVTVSVDDASTSKTYRSSTGRVSILDEWWALLGLTPSGGQAFNIDSVSTSTTHLPWCSANTYVDASGAVVYGGAYCTCGADIAGYPIYEGGGYWV